MFAMSITILFHRRQKIIGHKMFDVNYNDQCAPPPRANEEQAISSVHAIWQAHLF